MYTRMRIRKYIACMSFTFGGYHCQILDLKIEGKNTESIQSVTAWNMLTIHNRWSTAIHVGGEPQIPL